MGRVVIKRAKQHSLGLNDATLLVGAILIIFLGNSIWQLKFSKPMVSEILNLSLHEQTDKKFKFKEIRDVDNLLKKQSQELNNLAVKAIVAQMTQMLAHDTRRPFTMVEGVLSLIESSNDMEEIKVIVKQYIPEVRKALQTVNAMITDVMEVGNNREPEKETIHIESIIESILNDCFRFNKLAGIRFDYRFQHQHQLHVHVLSISRVFSNIVANAAQEINYRGRIWFETQEADATMIITIGNSDSYIPPEDREQIFNLFYTKNKKGGTGLGLAIAKKIVTAHGGNITCRSERKKGTEFIFKLPTACGFPAQDNNELPASTLSLRKVNLIQVTGQEFDIDKLERKILASGQNIHILMADDESVYRNSLSEQVSGSAIGKVVKMTFVRSGEDAVAAAQQFDPTLIIMDIDFNGCGDINGFEAVRQIRRNGCHGKIFIHSNHSALEFHTKTVDRGFDLFIPKPMTTWNLLTIIEGSVCPRESIPK